MTGKKLSIQTRLKQSKARLGKHFGPMSEQGKINISIAQRHRKHVNWKGGKIIVKGYRLVKNKSHPNRTKNNYILESRLIAEDMLGRYLKPEEVVHHINKNTLDNRSINLMVFKNTSAHSRWHGGKNKLRKEDVVYPASFIP